MLPPASAHPYSYGGIPTELERINKNRTADCNGVLDNLLI